jgi:hypothetical protein
VLESLELSGSTMMEDGVSPDREPPVADAGLSVAVGAAVAVVPRASLETAEVPSAEPHGPELARYSDSPPACRSISLFFFNSKPDSFF